MFLLIRTRQFTFGVALIVGCISAAVASRDFSAWRWIPSADLVSLRVGAPGNNSCCVKAASHVCGYSCVSNPYCPPNVTTDSTCGEPPDFTATCGKINDPNSLCNKPARPATFGNYRCTTTGNAITCVDPPGTFKCEVTLISINVAYTTCNVGESLCPDTRQPQLACF